eukprot:UC4_evm6s805
MIEFAPGSPETKSAVKSYLQKNRLQIWKTPYTENSDSGLPNEATLHDLATRIKSTLDDDGHTANIDELLYELNILRIKSFEKFASKKGFTLSEGFKAHKRESLKKATSSSKNPTSSPCDNTRVDNFSIINYAPGSTKSKEVVKAFLKKKKLTIWNPPYSAESGLPNIDALKNLANQIINNTEQCAITTDECLFEVETLRIKSYEKLLAKSEKKPSAIFLKYKEETLSRPTNPVNIESKQEEVDFSIGFGMVEEKEKNTIIVAGFKSKESLDMEVEELANILQEYYEKVVPPENQKSNEDLVKLAEKVTSGDEDSRERLFSALEKKVKKNQVD